MIFEFSGSRPTSQFKNPKIFEFSRVRLKLHDSIKFRNPGFLHNRHVRRNRQIIQKISSMRKLLTNRVVPAQNFLAKIDKFSQKSASFRKNLQIFVKNSFFSQKTANFRKKKTANFRKNRYIFAKICIFSQKSVNFSQKSANFRKNLQIFAKIVQIFANICKFVIFEFSGSRPTSQFKNPKIFEFSRLPPKPNRVNFAHRFVVT